MIAAVSLLLTDSRRAIMNRPIRRRMTIMTYPAGSKTATHHHMVHRMITGSVRNGLIRNQKRNGLTKKPSISTAPGMKPIPQTGRTLHGQMTGESTSSRPVLHSRRRQRPPKGAGGLREKRTGFLICRIIAPMSQDTGQL